MYFLDFDRTVFDTDSFISYLRTHPTGAAYVGEGNDAAAPFKDAIENGSFSFTPGELSRFLYEDAVRFLRDKENGVMLITYGNKALQMAKVESALYGIPRIATHYTGDVRKGDFIAPHIGMYGSNPVFVDDSVVELEILSSRCPHARVIEMRRDGGPGDGRWQVIANLSSLV